MKGIYDGDNLLTTFTEDPLEALKPKVNLQGLSADEDYIYLDDEPIFIIKPVENSPLGKLVSLLRMAKFDLQFAALNPDDFDENNLLTHAKGMFSISKVLEGKAKDIFHVIGMGLLLFSSQDFMKKAEKEEVRKLVKLIETVENILEKKDV